MSSDITSGYDNLSRKIKISLVLLFFLVTGIPKLAWPYPDSQNFAPLMSLETFKKLNPESMAVIDTRSTWHYFLGHIPGAVNLSDWQDFTEKHDGVRGLLIQDRQWIAKKLSSLGIDHEKTIVIYGNPQDQWRSDGRFFWMFHYFGFNKVALLENGYHLWASDGGAIERGTSPSKKTSRLSVSDIQFNSTVAADQNWILERLNSPNLALIDNRTRSEYDGATPYGSDRGGHIPKAIHIDWRDFFTDAGLLKNKTDLMEQLKRYGVTPDKEAVVYCTGGVRSAMAYFVLNYLGYRVRNYDGSWWDWSRNPTLPVES